MRIDIVVDIETLGLSSVNPIIQIGAVAFDIDSGVIIDKFKMSAMVRKDVTINGETLKWWLEVNPTLLKSIICEATATEDLMLLRFIDWISKFRVDVGFNNVFLWGNGILFDNKILKDKIESYGMAYPIWYRNDRDVRTIVDVYCEKFSTNLDELKKKFTPTVEHDGLEDALAEANMLHYCWSKVKA